MSAQQPANFHLSDPICEDLLRIKALVVDRDVTSLDRVQRVLKQNGMAATCLASIDNAIRYLSDAAELPSLMISGPGMSQAEKFQLIASVRYRLGIAPQLLPAMAFSTVEEPEGVRPAWWYLYQAHLRDSADERQILGAICRLINRQT